MASLSLRVRSTVLFACLAVACGGSEFSAGPAGTGGTKGTGGSSNTGGQVTGSGGSSTTGGSSTGGSPGSGGSQVDAGNGSGGSNSGGSGTGGAVSSAGAGGVEPTCEEGSVACNSMPQLRCGEDGKWHSTDCGPLMLSDIQGLEVSGLPSLDVGFRCKAIAVCGVNQSCLYSDALGSRQSSEDLYYDGIALPEASAVKVRISAGAASQCGNPEITIDAGESIKVKIDDATSIVIYFPSFTGQELTLYVREDGATFYDAGLTDPAQPAP